MLKNPPRSLPREQVVMRFSSNEGQNMAPDVILILIKERGGCCCCCCCWRCGGVGWVLERILLNTINPFFNIWREQGPKGEDAASPTCSRAVAPCVWRHGGQRPVIKGEAGPERPGQHLIPAHPPSPPGGPTEVGRGLPSLWCHWR